MKFKIALFALVLFAIVVGCAKSPSVVQVTPRLIGNAGIQLTPDATHWLYVVFGDSEAFGFPAIFARYISEDKGVELAVVDYTEGGMTIGRLLDKLTWDDVKIKVSQARVITFEANPSEYLGTYCIDQSGEFINSEEAYGQYQAAIEEVIKQLFELRKGEPTIIIAQNFYNPIYNLYKERGDSGKCVMQWSRMNEAISNAAEKYGIVVADVFSAFNGSSHGEDPREKGYIHSDGEHPSDAGNVVIADVFRALGYPEITP